MNNLLNKLPAIIILLAILVFLFALTFCTQRVFYYTQRILSFSNPYIKIGETVVRIKENWLLESIYDYPNRKRYKYGFLAADMSSEDLDSDSGMHDGDSDLNYRIVYSFTILDGCKKLRSFTITNISNRERQSYSKLFNDHSFTGQSGTVKYKKIIVSDRMGLLFGYTNSSIYNTIIFPHLGLGITVLDHDMQEDIKLIESIIN